MFPPDFLAIVRITVIAGFIAWAGQVVGKVVLSLSTEGVCHVLDCW